MKRPESMLGANAASFFKCCKESIRIAIMYSNLASPRIFFIFFTDKSKKQTFFVARPLKERKEVSPSPAIDHRPYGAVTYEKEPRKQNIID